MAITQRMTHPDLKADIRVAPSAVPFHMASGWVPVDDVPPAAKKKTPAKAPAKTEPKPEVKENVTPDKAGPAESTDKPATKES